MVATTWIALAGSTGGFFNRCVIDATVLPACTKIVCPSGRERAVYSIAMAPPAPVLFSTMTVRFAKGRSFSAKKRTITSAPLPAGKAQISRMSPLGKVCAVAPFDTTEAVSANTAAAKRDNRNFIVMRNHTIPDRSSLFLERLLAGRAELRHHDQCNRRD